ncbi:thiamine diphosphokinase [Sulfitobacter noctilucae]|uniref:thiamine diphosphokinase n=1 Tax=Sulfitobacter noctilucae TaxID=1342302 RepID=UPI0004687973|nr:thiamine diphosphokinase [Sulfitobacter noctilucae]
MFEPIVHSSDPVTLVGGGQATPNDLHKALTLAPLCVAADGGAGLALAAKVEPAAVIGDFDSITEDALGQIPDARRYRVTEQESTDFEKALTRIAAPLILGVGFLGGRIDHELAAMHILMRYPDRPCILIGAEEVICLAPPDITVPTRPGDAVSLFPLGTVTGQSEGLEWPIDDLHFAPGQRIGTSNRAVGPVRLQMNAPAMLLILPRAIMPELVAAVSRPEAARWPVRAR